MTPIKYGAGGYHMTNSEVADLLISIKCVIACLSQRKVFPADIEKAKKECQYVIDKLGIA